MVIDHQEVYYILFRVRVHVHVRVRVCVCKRTKTAAAQNLYSAYCMMAITNKLLEPGM
jgi:hypothetical protein